MNEIDVYSAHLLEIDIDRDRSVCRELQRSLSLSLIAGGPVFNCQSQVGEG